MLLRSRNCVDTVDTIELESFHRAASIKDPLARDTYAGDKKVTPLVTQLPWTRNLIIMTQSNRPQERVFYLRMAIQKRWDRWR